MDKSQLRGLLLSGFVVAAFLVAVSQAIQPVQADVSGVSRGHAHSVEASILGLPITINDVVLPPGGNKNIPINLTNILVLNSGTATTSCTDNSTTTVVSATCSSTINSLSVGLGVIDLLSATEITAVSTTTDNGSGPVTSSAGTDFGGICLQQTLLGSCTPITQPGNFSINILGVASGSLTVREEVARSSDNGVDGAGLTVTMLRLSLNVLGSGLVNLEFAEADSFVGDVVTFTPTPPPTATSVPTATNTAVPTATNTAVPTATNTAVPTATNTAVPTATSTAVPTNTAVPTATSTAVPTNTAVPTATNTVVPTATSTVVPTATAVPTSTPPACSTPPAAGDLDDDGYPDFEEAGLNENHCSFCPIMRADVDHDRNVTVLDLALVASWFLEDIDPAPSRYNQGEPGTRNGTIDTLDLARIGAVFLRHVSECDN